MSNSDKAVAIAKFALVVAAGAAPMANPNASVVEVVAGATLSGVAITCAAKVAQSSDRRS